MASAVRFAKFIAAKPTQRLIATARDPSSLSYLADNDASILKLALDVTSPVSVDNAFKAAAAHFGEAHYVDVVVNNAGYSLSGDTEAATEEEAHDEMETVFFGTARVTMRAVEAMRQDEQRRGGLIFNISSLAGLCAFPGHAYYHASKFAVEGWTASVAREMHPDWNSRPMLCSHACRFSSILIVNFCIVEPSGVRTDFESRGKVYMKPHPAYSADDMPSRKLEAFVKQHLKSGAGMIDPAAIANALYEVASRDQRIPLHLPLGTPALKLIKSMLEGRLRDLESIEAMSAVDQKTQT